MKITKTTFKTFIKKNAAALLIRVSSRFDGMTDGVESTGETEFTPVQATTRLMEHSYGIAGVWLVGGGRDYFTAYEKDGMVGMTISNCCGSCTLVIPAEGTPAKVEVPAALPEPIQETPEPSNIIPFPAPAAPEALKIEDFKVGQKILMTTRTNRGEDTRLAEVTAIEYGGNKGMVTFGGAWSYDCEAPQFANERSADVAGNPIHLLPSGSGAFFVTQVGTKPFGLVKVRIVPCIIPAARSRHY